MLIKIFPTTPKAHSSSSKIFSYNLVYKFFSEEIIHSVFENFCTASPNVMEPNKAQAHTPPPHRELSKDTKEHDLKHPITTKQNKLPSFIHRSSYHKLTRSEASHNYKTKQTTFLSFIHRSSYHKFWETRHNLFTGSQ